MAALRRFEFVEGGSSKFWEVEVDGAAMTVRYGKIGTAGSIKEKTFSTATEAAREADKLITEKTRKGYEEVGGAVAAKGSTAKRETAAKAASRGGQEASGAKSPGVVAMLEAISNKEKSIADGLRSGAADSDLETLRKLGAPTALLALYAAHDGSDGSFFGPWSLLPIERIRGERDTMKALLADAEWRATGTWNERWIPFLSDGNGNLVCVDPIGALEGSAPGTLVRYDHESGPVRAFPSFDVFVELVTTLARKRLLDEQVHEDEEKRAEFEEALAAAQSEGLPKMPPKDLKKVLKEIDEGELNKEQILAKALPLARQFPAERELWKHVAFAARALERWALLAEAADTVDQLTPARDRPVMGASRVLALHKLGRDQAALSAASSALKSAGARQYPLKQIPDEVEPAFRLRCLALATETHPKNYFVWLHHGAVASEPKERASSLEKALALAKDKKVVGYDDSGAAKVKAGATCLLELDRASKLGDKKRLEALLELAKKHGGAPGKDIWEYSGRDDGLPASCTAWAPWVAAAELASELRDWTAAERAWSRVFEFSEARDELRARAVAGRACALHESGDDEGALKSLRSAMEETSDWAEEPSVLEAIPEGVSKGFRQKILALASEALPENAFVWQALAAASPNGRRAALEKALALSRERTEYEPDPERNPDYNKRMVARAASYRALHERVKGELRA